MTDRPAPPSAVRLEHHREAFGIGETRPRVSWLNGADPTVGQTAYEVAIASPDGVESSGRVPLADSVLVPWPAADLASRGHREVRVRVWDDRPEPSDWSEPAAVEVGLLHSTDWTARLVGAPAVERRPVLLRTTFDLPEDAVSARLYVTAQGLYEARLNGAVVGDQVLTPGWTSYHHRLRYQTYDITHLLRRGRNVLGATVADGWYRGRLAWPPGRRDVYGDRTGLLAQLEVRTAGGDVVTVATDGTWQWTAAPVTAADLYDGESHDAARDPAGWCGGDPADPPLPWSPVELLDRAPATLVAPDGPPVRRIEELPVAEVSTSPSGKLVLDFGQNLVGRLRIRVHGPRGHVVVLRHAEVLQDGELATVPLRSARAEDRYSLSGDPAGEVWEPRFTVHGFRYAEVEGWPGEFDPAAVTAVVLHSDLERTGWFACSDSLVTQLHENVVWGMRGNVVDVPTDCPQRDERLGWTGDIQVFAPTASYLFDSAGFLTSWLRDLAADQDEGGVVPLIVPHVELETAFGEPGGVAGWGDAAVVVPWVLHERFGDVEVLRRQYPSMVAWVDAVTAGLDDDLWDGPAFQLGDWLDPAAPPDAPWRAATDSTLVATAYRAQVARLLAGIAQRLGEEADAVRFGELAARVRARFAEEYVTPRGRVVGDSQTGYALALEFGLLGDDARRTRAGERLVEVVRVARHHIGTGFLGTPVICDALTTAGAVDDAYQLLLQTGCPSWLYPVTQGATTVWERWDSLLPDGTLNSSGMTSFNHYALGAVADWLHRVVAGLAPAAPGYRDLVVQPRPGGGLRWARAEHRTPYGTARVAWERTDTELVVDVVVPPGSTATVQLPDPGARPERVGPGEHRFSCPFRAPADDPAPASNKPESL